MFKCNVGKVDRIVRVVLGLVLIALGFYFNTWWGAIGVIPLVTAAIGWCPLYRPLGITTCSTQS
jgi:hypothetical protein